MGRLDQKRVLITGAGSGIGEGFAKGLAAEGATIGIVDLNLEHAESVADEINASGGKALALAADVAERTQMAAAISRFVEFSTGLDVIFNNAGFNKPMPLLEVTEENFNAIMRVNGLGCAHWYSGSCQGNDCSGDRWQNYQYVVSSRSPGVPRLCPLFGKQVRRECSDPSGCARFGFTRDNLQLIFAGCR